MFTLKDVVPGDVKIFRGRHSKVIAVIGLNLVLKIFPKNLKSNAYKEKMLLEHVNNIKLECFPKFYGIVDTGDAVLLVKEYIDGQYFNYFIKHGSIREIKKVIKRLLLCLHELDKVNYVIKELSNPKTNIVIRDEKPFIIDLERWTKTHGKTNVTQFLGFLIKISKSNDNPLKQRLNKIINFQILDKIANSYKKEKSIDVVLNALFQG